MDIGQLSRSLQKSHIILLSNDETRFYSGSIMLGKSEIVDHVPTACTDGVNKLYGYGFMADKEQAEVNGVVMHENLHVSLKHMLRFGALIRRDAKTANAAMDYVVNGLIHKLKGYGDWIKLPDPHLYDAKFDGWSVNEVYEYLTTGRKPDGSKDIHLPPQKGQQQQPSKPQSGGSKDEDQDDQGQDAEGDEEGDEEPNSVYVGGKEYSLETQDEHKELVLSEADAAKLDEQITEAIMQATALAGVLGLNLPREFTDAAKPEVNWKEEVSQFFSEFSRGNEEFSYKRYNKRRMLDDMFMPSLFNERIPEIMFAVDASGSMHGELFDKACTGVVDAIEALDPELVRILFWDTSVCSDQEFHDDYNGVREALKPRGGGGTRASCVVDYIKAKGYAPTCIVVLTDGYLEHDIKWETDIPTLWVVMCSEQFVPPVGRKVRVKI